MAIDYEIFDGKSLSSLFKDIYDNTEFNRKQLEVLTKELVQFIKDGDTAVQIVPMIKEYLEKQGALEHSDFFDLVAELQSQTNNFEFVAPEKTARIRI